ncbi:MAG: hypothetical protein O3A47_13575 [Chloroflexi bacterium]|nr:hypothetical protein [Chloroflexota bacterium]
MQVEELAQGPEGGSGMSAMHPTRHELVAQRDHARDAINWCSDQIMALPSPILQDDFTNAAFSRHIDAFLALGAEWGAEHRRLCLILGAL